MEENTKKDEKIKLSVWLKILKEFFYFKKLFIFGLMMGAITGAGMIVQPKLTKYIIDNFIKDKDISNFTPVLIFMIVFVLLLGITTFFYVYLMGKLQMSMCHRLRMKCFKKLQKLSISYYDKNAVGWIMARLTSDINKLSAIISWGMVELVWIVFMFFAILIAMFTENLKLGLFVLVPIPLIILFSFAIRGKILNAQRRFRKINSEVTAAYNEDIQGVQTTKTLVREDLNLQDFVLKTEEMRKASIYSAMLNASFWPVVNFFAAMGIALLIIYGGLSFFAGIVTLGLLISFVSYAKSLNGPIADIAYWFSDFLSAQAAAERIFDIIEEPLEIHDSPEILKKYGLAGEPSDSVEKLPKIKGDIEFKDVSFWYKDGSPILENFNLSVKAGETIALVGATGSGKSTIVNLFCRFYEPKHGKILIDGIDYTEMPQAWIQENLGFVLQSPYLFAGSIAENIRYGNLDASDEEIIQAAKLVNAHDFIINFKDGYDTEVGETGGLLSTGQKQLVSFARTIVRNPQLFVLDEATSSIDTETEQKIQHAIAKILEGRTSFVVAHRLSTIKNADKIIVIEAGKIIEAGTHAELMQKKQHYYELYTQQFIRETS